MDISHHLLLVIHLLGAAVWVGGHLILSTTILPEALKRRNPEILTNFEEKYEKIGMPALIIMVITGIWMAYQFGQGFSQWFQFSNPLETVISLKLLLLLTTVAFAISARFFVIPKLSSKTLPLMAIHIVAVTILGLAMLVLGSFVRYGGISI